MRTVFWDVETRSVTNLRDAGAYIYAIDPSTQILCVCFAISNEEPQIWLPEDPVPAVFFEIAGAAAWISADPAEGTALHAAPGPG
jgi:DNA polymerase